MTRPSRDSRAGHDRWLVSYADLMTLLLAFFTTLYAASTVDANKLAPVAASLQQALNVSAPAPASAAAPAADLAPEPIAPASEPDSRTHDVQRELERMLADAVDARRVEIVRDRRGLVVSLPEDASFATGSAEATAGALELIRRVGETVRPTASAVRIEGHTDDVPIRTARYASNWELSTARASAVVAFLVQEVGMEAARLSAAGYGEFHPRVANESPAQRARNRRVDIVVLEPSDPPDSSEAFR